jgi:cytochrome c peroxidase
MRSTLKKALLALMLVAGAAPLSACGGGGVEAAQPAGTPEEPETPAPVTPTPPPPAPVNPLETELRDLAARGDAGLMLAPPAQNADLVALGQALFFDRVLSGNLDTSCATCHSVGAATGDGLSVSIGAGGHGNAPARTLGDGALIARNSPPLFRLARQPTMFWDSRVQRRQDGTLVTPEPALNGPQPSAALVAAQLTTALAAQAMFPVTSPEEMRGEPGDNELADATDNLDVWRRLMLRLVGTDADPASGIAGYRTLFARAFPAVSRVDDLTFGHAARAIAAFEVDAFATSGSAFDRWLAGDASALTDAQRRGGILFFGRADCAQCHGGPAFTDGRHHAIGVPQVGPGKDFPFEDTGRALVTGDPDDAYRFRTPSLRNVAITGPWMHDGAYTTLAAAVRHYRDPEESLASYDARQLSALLLPTVDVDPLRQAARADAISGIVRGGVNLNARDVADLVAFLESLTDADALDVLAAKPASVPSGLPLDD